MTEENERLTEKTGRIADTMRRRPGVVPNMIHNHMATIAWAGKRAVDIIDKPEEFVGYLLKVFGEMWCDGSIQCGNPISGTPRLEAAIEDPINRFGPDGTTPEHLQRSCMKEDEYDIMMKSPTAFLKNVILPRAHSAIFENKEKGKEILKVFAEDKFYMMAVLPGMIEKALAEDYGIPAMTDMSENFQSPLDVIFDYFRGFQGTFADLRRQPGKVKESLEAIWEDLCMPIMNRPYALTDRWAPQMPHIPAYLNPKQFAEFYWPYEEKQLRRIADAGGKAYIILEGRWKHIWEHFLDVPKDCCVLHWDDDDFMETYRALGSHQFVIGGLRTADIRLKEYEPVREELQRTLDVCAPEGGLLLCTDKSWITPGDVNQNLIDLYNYAHEYTTK